MSNLSLQDRLEIAADKGAKISEEDWVGTEEGEAELDAFLDSFDVPREKEE